eukprot:2378302-Ditylum_brightwellii.AAC.1
MKVIFATACSPASDRSPNPPYFSGPNATACWKHWWYPSLGSSWLMRIVWISLHCLSVRDVVVSEYVTD